MESNRVDLVVAAAQELKAPLVLIRHLAQVLKDADLNLRDRQELVDRITITAERSLQLTSQLTTDHFIDLKKLDGALEPVNVQYICEQVLNEMTPYAKKLDQHLYLKTSKKPKLAIANSGILHDVITNIVDGSIKNNPRGGVVELSTSLNEKLFRLKVKDNGPYIEKSEFVLTKNNLGEQAQPFSGRPGASGLGIYVAGRLTAAMGGELSLGRPKHGAVFLIDLLSSSQIRFL